MLFFSLKSIFEFYVNKEINLKFQLSELDNVTNLNVINVMASNDYEDKTIGINYCFFRLFDTMHSFCFELLIKHKPFLVHFSSYPKIHSLFSLSNDYEEIKKIYLEEEEKKSTRFLQMNLWIINSCL